MDVSNNLTQFESWGETFKLSLDFRKNKKIKIKIKKISQRFDWFRGFEKTPSGSLILLFLNYTKAYFLYYKEYKLSKK